MVLMKTIIAFLIAFIICLSAYFVCFRMLMIFDEKHWGPIDWLPDIFSTFLNAWIASAVSGWAGVYVVSICLVGCNLKLVCIYLSLIFILAGIHPFIIGSSYTFTELIMIAGMCASTIMGIFFTYVNIIREKGSAF
jgi:hypothetical protein